MATIVLRPDYLANYVGGVDYLSCVMKLDKRVKLPSSEEIEKALVAQHIASMKAEKHDENLTAHPQELNSAIVKLKALFKTVETKPMPPLMEYPPYRTPLSNLLSPQIKQATFLLEMTTVFLLGHTIADDGTQFLTDAEAIATLKRLENEIAALIGYLMAEELY